VARYQARLTRLARQQPVPAARQQLPLQRGKGEPAVSAGLHKKSGPAPEFDAVTR
jgi:hypothetical protein